MEKERYFYVSYYFKDGSKQGFGCQTLSNVGYPSVKDIINKSEHNNIVPISIIELSEKDYINMLKV